MARPPFSVTMNDNGTSKPSYKWRRVLLKVSGEALAGDRTQNIDPKVWAVKAYNGFTFLKLLEIPNACRIFLQITMAIAREVASVTRLGIEVGFPIHLMERSSIVSLTKVQDCVAIYQ